MSELTPRSSDANSAAGSQTLSHRVVHRVKLAALAADRRANATHPKAARRKQAAPYDPRAASLTRTPELRLARSLRRVFRDLGESYRAYLRQTGGPVSLDVRDSAYRFRRELNLASLVPVADGLDELHILPW